MAELTFLNVAIGKPARWDSLGSAKLIELSARQQRSTTVRFLSDHPAFPLNNVWTDLCSSVGTETGYVVQTSAKIAERCVLRNERSLPQSF